MLGNGLQAGFAKTIITPPEAGELSGFVARRGLSQGVHDPLYTRALVISNRKRQVALAVSDLIGCDNGMVREIRRRVVLETDLAPEAVICCATHTHSGPAVLERGFLGKADSEYREFLITKITATIVDATRSTEPALLYAGNSECDIGKNRRYPGGATVPRVSVLRLEMSGGRRILWTNYACHPVVLGPDNMLITADYPHYLIKKLESFWPETEVLFTNGATGDVNVGHNAADSIRQTAISSRTFAEAERLANILADKVIAASETAVYQDVDGITIQKAELCLPFDKVLDGDGYRGLADGYRQISVNCENYGERRQYEIWTQWADIMRDLAEQGYLEMGLTTEVTAFSIGNIEFVTLPGEFFHELGLSLRRSRAGKNLFILGYANDSIGYVAPASEYPKGGYEIEDSFRYYGLPSKLAAGAGETIVAVLEKMLSKSVTDRR